MSATTERVKHAATPGTHPTKDYRWLEPHSTNFVKQTVKPGMTCIDVGAKIGWYAMICSLLAKEKGSVFAVEPLRAHFGGLEANGIQLLQEFPDSAIIQPKHIALSDKVETRNIKVAGIKGFTLIDGDKEDTKTQLVNFTTLDQFVITNQCQRVDFIKVDIDGHEVKFLRGAVATLKKYKPLMLVEFGWAAKARLGDDLNEGIDILEKFGYTFYNSRGVPLIPNRKARNPFPIKKGSGINVVCMPNGKPFPKIELL